MFFKIGLLKKFAKRTGKHLYRSLFLNKVAGLCNFIKKETLVQVISGKIHLYVYHQYLYIELLGRYFTRILLDKISLVIFKS